MKPITIRPAKKISGIVTPPGDKSISHRAAILSSIAPGKTVIKNFLFSDDCLVTLKVLSQLGVKITLNKAKSLVTIVSRGYFLAPRKTLRMGESGTSCRVLLGLLAGQPFVSRIAASSSLVQRPMARVIEPLNRMGACIRAHKRGGDAFLPMQVFPSHLCGITWRQKISSAQVKSAILLAGLYADTETRVIESFVSRDHTERMLKLFRARIAVRDKTITIEKSRLVSPGIVLVPGDISSAAFFIVAALLLKGSKILVKDVCVNPTRAGILNVLQRMGGNIKFLNKRDFSEPVADIEVTSSPLSRTVIRAGEIPSLIDELPIFMVAASLACGKSVIEGAAELRVKETDRIGSMVTNLMKLGVNIRVKSVKKSIRLEITGSTTLKGARLKSFGDHRTAMSMYVAALASQGSSSLDDISCMNKSFPGFCASFNHLLGA